MIVAPATALATHGFSDVSNSDFFHAAVDWMKDNGVTVGCNPPQNTRYCPDDPVTRGEMAVFLERLDTQDVFLRPGEVELDGDADTLDGEQASAFRTLIERVTKHGLLAIFDGCVSYDSVTIEVPVAGAIMVEADVRLDHKHYNGDETGARLYLGTSASDCTQEKRPDSNLMTAIVPDSAVTDVYFTQTHVSRQFDVSAGTHTFYLNGAPSYLNSSGAARFRNSALWATFYPG